MKGKAADYHMLVRMIREIKVPRDRFRSVLVVFLYVKGVLGIGRYGLWNLRTKPRLITCVAV